MVQFMKFIIYKYRINVKSYFLFTSSHRLFNAFLLYIFAFFVVKWRKLCIDQVGRKIPTTCIWMNALFPISKADLCGALHHLERFVHCININRTSHTIWQDLITPSIQKPFVAKAFAILFAKSFWRKPSLTGTQPGAGSWKAIPTPAGGFTENSNQFFFLFQHLL